MRPVHRRNVFLRWERGQCNREESHAPGAQLTSDATKVTCPDCLKWQAEAPWKSLSPQALRQYRREQNRAEWAKQLGKKP